MQMRSLLFWLSLTVSLLTLPTPASSALPVAPPSFCFMAGADLVTLRFDTPQELRPVQLSPNTTFVLKGLGAASHLAFTGSDNPEGVCIVIDIDDFSPQVQRTILITPGTARDSALVLYLNSDAAVASGSAIAVQQEQGLAYGTIGIERFLVQVQDVPNIVIFANNIPTTHVDRGTPTGADLVVIGEGDATTTVTYSDDVAATDFMLVNGSFDASATFFAQSNTIVATSPASSLYCNTSLSTLNITYLDGCGVLADVPLSPAPPFFSAVADWLSLDISGDPDKKCSFYTSRVGNVTLETAAHANLVVRGLGSARAAGALVTSASRILIEPYDSRELLQAVLIENAELYDSQSNYRLGVMATGDDTESASVTLVSSGYAINSTVAIDCDAARTRESYHVAWVLATTGFTSLNAGIGVYGGVCSVRIADSTLQVPSRPALVRVSQLSAYINVTAPPQCQAENSTAAERTRQVSLSANALSFGFNPNQTHCVAHSSLSFASETPLLVHFDDGDNALVLFATLASRIAKPHVSASAHASMKLTTSHADVPLVLLTSVTWNALERTVAPATHTSAHDCLDTSTECTARSLCRRAANKGYACASPEAHDDCLHNALIVYAFVTEGICEPAVLTTSPQLPPPTAPVDCANSYSDPVAIAYGLLVLLCAVLITVFRSILTGTSAIGFALVLGTLGQLTRPGEPTEPIMTNLIESFHEMAINLNQAWQCPWSYQSTSTTMAIFALLMLAFALASAITLALHLYGQSRASTNFFAVANDITLGLSLACVFTALYAFAVPFLWHASIDLNNSTSSGSSLLSLDVIGLLSLLLLFVVVVVLVRQGSIWYQRNLTPPGQDPSLLLCLRFIANKCRTRWWCCCCRWCGGGTADSYEVAGGSQPVEDTGVHMYANDNGWLAVLFAVRILFFAGLAVSPSQGASLALLLLIALLLMVETMLYELVEYEVYKHRIALFALLNVSVRTRLLYALVMFLLTLAMLVARYAAPASVAALVFCIPLLLVYFVKLLIEMVFFLMCAFPLCKKPIANRLVPDNALPKNYFATHVLCYSVSAPPLSIAADSDARPLLDPATVCTE